MSILLSGDFHNNAREEIMYMNKLYLIECYGQKLYDEINYHIILGDCGFLWPGQDERDAYNYEILSNRSFPILCVQGNHEPVYGRTDLPEVDIGIGEKVILVNKEKPFIAFLKRGKIYNIDNRKFLVLGGALSIDKYRRMENYSWWRKEYWSDKEKSRLFTLLKNDNNFDYVLSHTGPDNINREVFGSDGYIDDLKFSDEVAVMNEKVDRQITCKQWFCGHFHLNRYYLDKEKNRSYVYLYKDTALLRENEVIIPFKTRHLGIIKGETT
jgi:hypothetical protein